MAIEDDAYWVARMKLTPAQQDALRRQAEQRARDAYDATTRAIAKAGEAASSGWSEASSAVDKFKAGVQAHMNQLLGQGGEIAAQMGGQITQGQDFEREMYPAAVENALGMGTEQDPGPGRLVNEWRTGNGPAQRRLDSASSFSRQFATAPSVRSHVQDATAAWKRRPGGMDAQSGTYQNGRVNFGLFDYVPDAIANNPAAHVVGSFRLDGEKRGDALAWTANNDMGLHSFYAGNGIDRANRFLFGGAPILPSVQDRSRPGPYGTTHQQIEFYTDLNGNPLE